MLALEHMLKKVPPEVEDCTEENNNSKKEG